MTPSHARTNEPQGKQAEHLRRVAEGIVADAPPTADRVVVVFGAKGGVGASAVALSIARDLARSTARGPGIAVLSVDAHAGRNDLAVMSGRYEEPTQGLAVTTATKLGVEPKQGAGAAVAEGAKRLLRAGRLWTDDAGGWIVIDAGVGDTLWARELASRAARPLLVTTVDPLATVNAYVALKRMGPASARVGVIVNHCPSKDQAEQTHNAIARSCRKFLSADPSLVGWMPTQSSDPTSATVSAAA